VTSPRHLLDQVAFLASRGRRPRHADLKRAISTIYYALFHAVAQNCADTLVGAKVKQSPAWHRVYRSLDHGKARSEIKRLNSSYSHGPVLQLAILFVELQELRHYADYDPGPSQLTRIGVHAYLKRTDTVLEVLKSHIEAAEWREIAVSLLFRDRKQSSP